MIILIEGGLGDGKTLLMCKYLKFDELLGKKIYSNVHLKNIEYEQLNIADFLENEDKHNKLSNATIGIDELTVFLDCRASSRKSNVYLSYLILQSRKRNLNIYATTQDINMVDKRVVKYTSILIIANRVYNAIELENGDVFKEEVKELRHYTVVDLRKARQPKFNSFVMDIRPYFKYYDTNEIIEPIDSYAKKKK